MLYLDVSQGLIFKFNFLFESKIYEIALFPAHHLSLSPRPFLVVIETGNGKSNILSSWNGDLLVALDRLVCSFLSDSLSPQKCMMEVKVLLCTSEKAL